MFLDRFSGFSQFHRHFVAVSRQGCRAVATLALVGLAACATPGGGPSGPAPTTPEARQALVTARANARWEALIKDDLDTAYSYMSPASREVLSLDKFKTTMRRGAFRVAKVDSVACDGDSCKVRLFLTYDHRQMKGITTPIQEAWIIDGNQAWYVN
jgi:hypothetical protein